MTLRSPLALLAFALLAFATPPLARAAEAVERTIAVDGVPRSYLVTVPATWDRRTPVPLLLVFHGWGSDPESMVAATGFAEAAERSPMVVAWLRALPGEQRFEVDPPAGRTSADVLFVDALVARLRERFPIDTRRIFATGFSNGAAFCYRLAHDRPDLLAAIGPVAGYRTFAVSRDPAGPIPLLHVHGTADDRVPAPPLRGSAGDAVRAWATRNRCAPSDLVTDGRSPEGLAWRRADRLGPTPRSDVALVLVEGVAHEWPGGREGFTTRLLLDFFGHHPKASPDELRLRYFDVKDLLAAGTLADDLVAGIRRDVEPATWEATEATIAVKGGTLITKNRRPVLDLVGAWLEARRARLPAGTGTAAPVPRPSPAGR